MEFKDQFESYIQQLNCTAKELSTASGLSAATLSRYRSGERIPEADSKNLDSLIRGIVQIAQEKNIPEITMESVSLAFSPVVKSSTTDIQKLQNNLHTLLTMFSVNVSELARFLNYDASYISRIRNGQRQPANPQEFALGIARFISRRYQSDADYAMIAELTGCIKENLLKPENYLHILSEWLLHGSSDSSDHFASFLEKLDGFDLNEYIRAIHFDEWKVPTAPFLLPTSKNYYGLKEMMESELSFLKATVLSKSMEPVTMYSDMPIAEMGKDPEFPKKWMFGMAMMLKKGLHLNQIHNLDRSFDDMMLGLESWIPMYMTGQISPYYLSGTQDNAFSHLLKVSGSVALTGEAINGYHAEGKYYLTKNKEEVAYYKKRASRLLAKASPLMEIFRQEKKSAYHSFLQADAKSGDERHFILSSLPLYTASDDLLSEIFMTNKISVDNQSEILSYVKMQRKLAEEMLAHSTCTVEIPMLKKEEFLEFPVTLSLSGMFFEKDVTYTWETYQKHLDLLQAFAAMHPNYTVVQNPSLAFRNIQIHIHTGKWVLVSKNNTPAIHFLIRHPKMRHAFENMVIPVYLLPK